MEVNTENQDFGMSDLISSIRKYGLQIYHRRWMFAVIFVFIGSVMVYRWATDKVKYLAKISFMLNDSEGSVAGFSSILGQIGLPTTTQRLNLQKILEIAKTRKIGERLYFKKLIIDGKDDLMCNHLISALDHEGKWFSSIPFFGKDSMSAYRFSETFLDSSHQTQRLAIKNLHVEILKKLSTSLNEKTGIMEIEFCISNEELGIQYIRSLYDELSEFYINKAIEKQEVTFRKLQEKVDSLRSVIFKKDYSLAEVKDSYRNTYLNQDAVPAAQIDRDIRMLSIIYGEALKNLELASFNLQNKTPFIQVLDLPIAPLDTKKQSLFQNLVIAVLVSFFVGIVVLVLQKVIKENS
ncbi:MAG: hypothetical protein IPM48_09300 [Saprospiraceae bacterium]|nr:hypothetical protein [Saprospiraceae bacterium]